jgi:hypothetical protein
MTGTLVGVNPPSEDQEMDLVQPSAAELVRQACPEAVRPG